MLSIFQVFVNELKNIRRGTKKNHNINFILKSVKTHTFGDLVSIAILSLNFQANSYIVLVIFYLNYIYDINAIYIRYIISTIYVTHCRLSACDHFVGLALKGSTHLWLHKIFSNTRRRHK